MDKEFTKYLDQLAISEKGKSKAFRDDPRHTILVHSGVLLNWLGDYFANPKIKWQKKVISINDIKMTGTTPEFNKIFIEKASRSPSRLLDMLGKDKKLKDKVIAWAGKKQGFRGPILLRKADNGYKVLDGMHRFVKMILAGEQKIIAYVPVSESREKPICEPHVIYDLIRGYLRHARDKSGQKQLESALVLLLRTYSNVRELLMNRFNFDYVPDKTVQIIIKRALSKTR